MKPKIRKRESENGGGTEGEGLERDHVIENIYLNKIIRIIYLKRGKNINFSMKASKKHFEHFFHQLSRGGLDEC